MPSKEQIEKAHAALMSELFLVCQPDRGDVFSFMDDHKELLRAALSAAEGVKPRVKPLEWEPGDGCTSQANSPIGLYCIHRQGHLFVVVDPFSDNGLDYSDEELAQAAAQVDYEARILSALQEGE